METVEVFVVQLVLSVIAFALFAKWYLAPWLSEKPMRQTHCPNS
jgi:hypothetical protein